MGAGMGAPPIVPQIAGAPNAAPSMPAPQPSIFETLSPEVLQGITGQSLASPTATSSPTTPVQNSPDFAVTPKVQPKTGQALAKSNKQYDAKQAQRAAYAASPEGKIANAEQGVMGAMDRQAEIATVAGDVNAAEADANAALLDERNIDLQSQQADIEATQKQREARLGELRTNHDKLVQAESSFKVDRGRKWANKSTGAKVAAGIAVAMTALGDALQYKSGPNLALQIIQQGIDDDVADQVRDFEQLGTKVNRARSSLDGYMKETGDIVASKQMLMAQRRLEAADEMEAVAAKFQSPKAKLQAEQNAAALRMEAQKYLGQSAESMFGREMQRGQLANARAQVGLGFANLQENQRQFDKGQELAANRLLLDAAKLDQEGNAAGAKAARDQAMQVKQLGIGGQVVQEAGPDGKPKVGYDALRNKDGQPFLAPTEKEAIENREIKASLDAVNQFTNEMVRGIAEHGGESQFFKSDAWQKMTANKAAIMNELRQASKMGTLDAGSLAVTEQMMGAADPTSYWQNASKGLLAGRDNGIAKLNFRLRSQGYDGADYKPPDTSTPTAPTSSAGDTLQKSALTPTVETDPEQNRRTFGVTGDENILELRNKVESQLVGGMAPDKKQALDTLYALTKSTDPKIAAENATRLKAVAESKTSDPKVVEYANTLLGAAKR